MQKPCVVKSGISCVSSATQMRYSADLIRPYDLTVELDILINNGQLVAERYVVCIGIFIREPDTVLGLGIVFLAADKRKEGTPPGRL